MLASLQMDTELLSEDISKRGRRLRGPVYCYGRLALILALIMWIVLDPALRHVGQLAIPLSLLFNHLAFQFRWSKPVMITLRALAFFWLIFVVPALIFRWHF